MAQCRDCRHWVNCDWDPFNHECSEGHGSAKDGPAKGRGFKTDSGYTDASGCPDFEPLPDYFGVGRATEDQQSREDARSRHNEHTGSSGGGVGGGSFSVGYSLGETFGKLAVIVLSFAFIAPGFILDKVFPDRRGKSRVWLYSLLFWPFVGGTIYLERHLGTPAWYFGIQWVLLSLGNIILGLAVSQSLFKPRLPLRAQTIFDKTEPWLPRIGWLGFMLGLFCLSWSLAANWPLPVVVPAITILIGGSILVRPVLAGFEPVTWFVGLACVAAAVFHLAVDRNLDLAAASVKPAQSSASPAATRDHALIAAKKPDRLDPAKASQPDKTSGPSRATAGVALASCDWSAGGSPDSRKRHGAGNLNYSLEAELERYPQLAAVMRGLAKAICRQADWETKLYGWTSSGDTVWAAGECPPGRGFICVSADKGVHWERQWYSTYPDPAYGIYFADSNEGWALTLQGILHTTDGGSSWTRILKTGYDIENLYVEDRNNLIVTMRRLTWQTTRDGGVSWEKAPMSPAQKSELQAAFGGPLHQVDNRWEGAVYYGKVLARAGTDKASAVDIAAITRPGRSAKEVPPTSTTTTPAETLHVATSKPESSTGDSQRNDAETKPSDGAGWRIWTSAGGSYTVKAQLVRVAGTAVILRKEDGKVISVKREDLSGNDWVWIVGQEKKRSGEPITNGSPPPSHGETRHEGAISGTWRASAGRRFRIDDDDTTLTVSLLHSTLLLEFNGRLTRRGEVPDAKSYAGTVHAVFRPDAPMRHSIKVTATLDALGRLNLHFADWPAWDQRGKYLGLRTLNETWTNENGDAASRDPGQPGQASGSK